MFVSFLSFRQLYPYICRALSMKISYSFLCTTIALFLSAAITRAQDCAPSTDTYNTDADVNSDGTVAASVSHDVENTC